MHSNKNILITGAAGFIGSHVLRLMVLKYPNSHFFNLDALTYAGNLENIKDTTKTITKLKKKSKDQVIKKFREGKIQLLVCTTVIEVGVDVPEATLMIIENPERLGLSQLHQLRGRVGRKANTESHCLLLYKEPLSVLAEERIKTMEATNDGFQIAEKDLELRGAGDIYGIRQSGLMDLKIANPIMDTHT